MKNLTDCQIIEKLIKNYRNNGQQWYNKISEEMFNENKALELELIRRGYSEKVIVKFTISAFIEGEEISKKNYKENSNNEN